MAVQIPEKFQQFRALVLDPTNEEKLVGYLKEYSAGGSYTGAYFNELTTTTSSDPNRIDIADVASLSLLSVTLKPEAVGHLIGNVEVSEKLERHLSAQPDRDLATLTPVEAEALEAGNLNDVWNLIQQANGVGRTRTSKLLARKRPRLIPIWDSVIAEVLDLPTSKDMWKIFHAALTQEGEQTLDDRLGELALKAGVAERYSRLRVLDILAWMYGKNKGLASKVYMELAPDPEEKDR
ncbi:hypothetical protein JOD52_003178 [Brachybacterium muris]|uniref:DUF6308 family protein n=1 Tax=Brachybacterium muris TaxID=219301 RepID=UPI001958D717|nr:DUF6308 family protein [Brachybacterium muris]MBM7502338.1 hypothetical protein [Brachybacterium muris]MCT1431842.1 DUF6308 family protein [Brachybacterium muris]MCT2296907.1 DUF6308 family protein [Brachybacterium muris]